MKNIQAVAKGVQRTVVRNSPSLLTAIGVSGTIGTAVLAGKASWKAAHRLSSEPPIETMTKREILEKVWDLYIPPVVAGSVTIGAILGAHHISSRRTAAAYSMLAIVEKGFSEYKEKVVEQIGAKKEQAVRDEVAQDRVTANPPRGDIILVGGAVLCMERLTGRYLACSVETLKRAENEVNATLLREGYATLNEFYYIIGAEPRTSSGMFGWQQDQLMTVDISYASAEDGRPCLVFDYSYLTAL